MMRIRTVGVAVALALGVSAAHAAGLGRLSVNSSLGQPLNAEIDLVSVQPGELDSLSARVATPEAYREARIEYSSSLRLLRFAVDKRPNGQPYLKVTSIGPINEPFVDVLIEVTWPAGRIQREYPILLDPPGYAQGKTTPPATTPSTSTPAAAAPQAAAPTPAPAQTQTATPSEGGGGARASSGAGPSAKAEMATKSDAPKASAAGDTYGPVQKGDTLRKIAEEVRPSSVSLDQMLVALYRENQGAFVNNNMNRLKSGQILKVPNADEVAKVTRGEAGKEIRSHVADWNSYREQLASGAAAIPSATPTSSNAASGRVGTAAVTPPAPPAADPGKDVLRVTKSEGGKAGAGKGGPQDRLNAVQEELIAKEKALQEANSRVAALEKQIADMQRLVELKGGAPGTTKPADTKVAAAPTPPPAAPAKPAEAPKAAEPTKPVDVPKPADAKPADAPKPADTAVAQAPTPLPVPGSTTSPATTTPPADASKAAAPTEPPKVAEAPKPPPTPPKSAAPKKPAPPKSFMDEVMDNPLWLAGGALAIVGLGALGFMAARRRRNEADAGTPSNMTSAFPSDLKPDTTTGRPAGGLVDTGNSSFLTDFDKTGPGTIDTDEVDPVAEAEVYIAYGRDAQAEEILKEAMARDRGRHEIALKLLEIYHARKSATAFETVAKELRTSVGESSPLWQKAAAMGAQIDPTNPLYAAAASGTATFTAMKGADAPAAKPDLDFDLDSAPSAQSQSSSAPAPDFDLDLGGTTPDRHPHQETYRNLQAQTPPPAPAPAQTSNEIDFDLAPSSDSRQAVDVPLDEPPKEDKPAFDFDLSGLDFPSSKGSDNKPDLDLTGTPSTSPSLDLTDLNLDTPADSGGVGGEAVGTKLELAKAYLEIGDKDGAREILQEVAKEGSSAQKEEAQKLIASL